MLPRSALGSSGGRARLAPSFPPLIRLGVAPAACGLSAPGCGTGHVPPDSQVCCSVRLYETKASKVLGRGCLCAAVESLSLKKSLKDGSSFYAEEVLACTSARLCNLVLL